MACPIPQGGHNKYKAGRSETYGAFNTTSVYIMPSGANKLIDNTG